MTRDELAALPLADRIKHVRRTHGGTQMAFAALLGTSANRVNAWERGRSAPGEEYAAKIAALEPDYTPDLFAPPEQPDPIMAELAAIRAQFAGAVEDRKRNDALMEERLQKALADPLARLAEVARDLAALVNGLREGDDGPPQAQQTHRPA